jgi:hypothetical protein
MDLAVLIEAAGIVYIITKSSLFSPSAATNRGFEGSKGSLSNPNTDFQSNF